MKLQIKLASLLLVSFIYFSCNKELPDLQQNLQADTYNASNTNTKKIYPKSIRHSFSSYVYIWDFIYNKKGEIDSIDVLVQTLYYGDWRFAYKVLYSGNKIVSITRTAYGEVAARLVNIKYHGGLIVQGDFYQSDNPPVQWNFEYDKKKRPVSSQIGERFYYDEKGNLVSYTHPIVPSENSTFISDDMENPMHRIPDLNVILLDHLDMAFYWYNPHNVISTTYNDGRTVTVDNRYDYFGNLIASYWSNINTEQWNFTY